MECNLKRFLLWFVLPLNKLFDISPAPCCSIGAFPVRQMALSVNQFNIDLTTQRRLVSSRYLLSLGKGNLVPLPCHRARLDRIQSSLPS